MVPFSLELTALRSLSAATFGLLLAFEPAIAAIAGFAIRGQDLTVVQCAGIALVIVAGAASLGPRRWPARRVPSPEPDRFGVTARENACATTITVP